MAANDTTLRRYLQLFLFLCCVTVSLVAGLCAVLPGIRRVLLKEDGVVEMLSALIFLCGAAWGFFVFVRARWVRKIPIPRFYLLIPLLALLGCLDELSFGERLFNFSMPDVYGMEMDGAHDVFEWGFKVLARQSRSLKYGLVLAVSLVTMLLLAIKGRRLLEIIRSFCRKHPPVLFVLIGMIFVLTSLVLDLGHNLTLRGHALLPKNAAQLAEESFELNSALALIFASMSIALRPSKPKCEQTQPQG